MKNLADNEIPLYIYQNIFSNFQDPLSWRAMFSDLCQACIDTYMYRCAHTKILTLCHSSWDYFR